VEGREGVSKRRKWMGSSKRRRRRTRRKGKNREEIGANEELPT
jgi:hypothetical protein